MAFRERFHGSGCNDLSMPDHRNFVAELFRNIKYMRGKEDGTALIGTNHA